jgi:hypothetical protein
VGNSTRVLWTIAVFLGASVLFGSLRQATEDSSTLVTVLVQVGALAVLVLVVVVVLRKLR